MIINPVAAEKLIRREIAAAQEQAEICDQQIAQLTQRKAQLEAMLAEWMPVVVVDEKPTE
mgnify:CR=1 FL=1